MRGFRKTIVQSLIACTGGEDNCLFPLHSETVASHLAGLSTLGFVYEYISRKAGFVTKVGSGVEVPEAGKLMGLAPYGSRQNHWHQWIKAEPGNYSLSISAYDIFLEVAALQKKYDDGQGKAYLRPYMVDLAYKVQYELEQALQELASTALKETGYKQICLAGGVALNSVANYKLYRRLNLEDIFIFPAAGDAGIAAGCALWAYDENSQDSQRHKLTRATLGRTYSREIINKALDKFSDQLLVQELEPKDVVPKTAENLAKGHIVARFSEGSEFGPRALGHRSIMVDPSFKRMKDVLNARVKFREAFRPFAPVIPQEQIATVFEQEVPSPFMLMVADIRQEYQTQLPAITHEDGTGRVQTVTAEDNPYFHAVCCKLAEINDGPPVLLNTSFNVAGQPIIETPEEAIQTFLNTNIDYLCIENLWIAKKHIPVKDYQEHLALVKDNTYPKGLPSNQPGVTELMRQLDRALFFGEKDLCPWSEEELKQLSAEGAHYKETSLMFADLPIGKTPATHLGKHAVMILNPVNGSDLVDPLATYEPLKLDYKKVSWVLAMLSGSDKLETLRINQSLTTAQALEEMQNVERLLSQRQIDTQLNKSKVMQDSQITGLCERTFALFEDPEFSARQSLTQLRQLLQKNDFNEQRVCSALGIEVLQKLEPTHLHYFSQYVLASNDFADLIRLFQLRCDLSESRLKELFGDRLFAVLVKLGLLIPRAGNWASRVDIFCVDGLYICTDHRFMLLPEDQISEQPVMYIGLDSLGLVHTAPRIKADRVLDLCSGSGIQALIASRYAKTVDAVDLQARAIRFARFNAQLNGIDNVQFHYGDLYDAVSGRKYDSILANPPFVPSPRQGDEGLSFREGGSEGEAILRRIIAESHQYLQQHGRLYVVTDLVDLSQYQQKLTTWWRGAGADMLVLHTADRDEILFAVPHCHWPYGQSFDDYNMELGDWVDNFRASNLKAVNFGYILIQKRPELAAPKYFSRCIHSPTKTIYERVESYFRQCLLQENLQLYPCRLRLEPDLQIRIERSVAESESKIELFVEDNPYFTTYSINKAILLELQYIAESRPLAKQYMHAGNKAWLQDLLGKGVLVLELMADVVCKSQQKYSGDIILNTAKTLEQGSDDQGANLEVAEIATKTTPTCLSSYLR